MQFETNGFTIQIPESVVLQYKKCKNIDLCQDAIDIYFDIAEERMDRKIRNNEMATNSIVYELCKELSLYTGKTDGKQDIKDIAF